MIRLANSCKKSSSDVKCVPKRVVQPIMNKKNTGENDTEIFVRTKIDEAMQKGIHRDYISAIKILESLLITHIEFLKQQEKYFYRICVLLCRAFTAIENPLRAIFYGKIAAKSESKEPSIFFFLGRAYFLNKNYKQAIAYFETFLQTAKNNAAALAMTAYAYLKAKQVEPAISLFEKALAIEPQNPKLNTGYLNALFVSAVKNFKNGSYELARQMFTFVINNGIDGVAPRLYLAHTLKGLNAYPEALTQYDAAVQFAPDDTSLQWYKALTLLQMHEVEAAAEVLAAVGLNIEGDSFTEQFLALGVVRQHIQKKEWQRAIVAARLYTKAFGASPEIHMLLAEAQKNLGHIENALNHYSRALELSNNEPIVFYAIFELLTDCYRWEAMQKAIVHAEKADSIEASDIYFYKVITAAHIDNPPEEVLPHLQAIVQTENYAADHRVYNALGVCYVKLGLPDIALRWYAKTLEQNPNDEEANVGIIACYEQMGEFARLIEAYDTYFKQFPSNIPLREDYIEFLQNQKNWAEVVQQLEILASITRERKDFDLAIALRKNGEFRRAAILFRNMLKDRQDEPILLHNLVYCLDKLGQTKVAIDILQLARKTFAENHDTMIIEGILCMHCNRKADAIRLFQYVAEKDPTNETARHYLNQVHKTVGH